MRTIYLIGLAKQQPLIISSAPRLTELKERIFSKSRYAYCDDDNNASPFLDPSWLESTTKVVEIPMKRRV